MFIFLEFQNPVKIKQFELFHPGLFLFLKSQIFNEMCYFIYISTDFGGDFSWHNSALINFEKDFTNCEPEVMDLLLYKHPWYVGSKAGCSCTFRHSSSVELGFGEPVDWHEEQSDEVEATKIFYDVVSSLISLINRR